MLINKRVVPVCLLAIFLVSCASKVITNLTPSQMPRNPSGQYLVEMKLDSSQQTLRHSSISPHFVAGFETFKMRPTHKITKRWEDIVPEPADREKLLYKFKVDYEYKKIDRQPAQGILMSQEYTQTIN